MRFALCVSKTHTPGGDGGGVDVHFCAGRIFSMFWHSSNACVFKFDVFGLCFDPSRFILMDQINSAGDIADYGDFM